MADLFTQGLCGLSACFYLLKEESMERTLQSWRCRSPCTREGENLPGIVQKPFPLKGQIRSILFKPIMWKAVPETFLSSTQLKKPNYPVLIARARTDCFVVKSTFLLANSWKKMLLQNNHPAGRRACTQGIVPVVYLKKTGSAGCNTEKHNHAHWATK